MITIVVDKDQVNSTTTNSAQRSSSAIYIYICPNIYTVDELLWAELGVVESTWSLEEGTDNAVQCLKPLYSVGLLVILQMILKQNKKVM